jgi:hypothetical protein
MASPRVWRTSITRRRYIRCWYSGLKFRTLQCFNKSTEWINESGDIETSSVRCKQISRQLKSLVLYAWSFNVIIITSLFLRKAISVKVDQLIHTCFCNYIFESVSPLHASVVKPPSSGGTKGYRLRSASKVRKIGFKKQSSVPVSSHVHPDHIVSQR